MEKFRHPCRKESPVSHPLAPRSVSFLEAISPLKYIQNFPEDTLHRRVILVQRLARSFGTVTHTDHVTLYKDLVMNNILL